jgi:hypothetical protein
LQFEQANAQTKNCKRACFSNADKIVLKNFPTLQKIKIQRHTARQSQQTMKRKLNIDKTFNDTVDRRPAGNSTFAIGGVSCSADSFVVAESFVLRMNICAEKPAHRKSANRYGQVYETT